MATVLIRIQKQESWYISSKFNEITFAPQSQLIFRHNICSTGYFSGGLLCVFSNYTPRPHDVLPSAVISYDCHHYDCRENTNLVTKLRECHLYHHPHLFVSDLNFISLFRPSCKSFPAADKARPPPIPISLVHQTHQAYAIMPKYGTSPDPQYWITIPPSTPSHPHYIWPRLMSVSGCRWSEERCRATHYQNLGPWSGSQGIKRKNRSKELDHHFQAASWFICIWVSFCRTGFSPFCVIFFPYFLYFVVLQIFYWPSELYFKLFIDGYTWSH